MPDHKSNTVQTVFEKFLLNVDVKVIYYGAFKDKTTKYLEIQEKQNVLKCTVQS